MKAIAGMAHLSGGGPSGLTCGGCAFFRDADSRCLKAIEMTGAKTKPVYEHELSCKYFKARPKRQRTTPTIEEQIEQHERRKNRGAFLVRPVERARRGPDPYKGDIDADKARMFLHGAHGQLSPELAERLRKATR